MQPRNFWKGLVTGVVVGATVSAVLPIDNRKVAKTTNKAFTTIGGVVDGVMNAIR